MDRLMLPVVEQPSSLCLDWMFVSVTSEAQTHTFHSEHLSLLTVLRPHY